MMNSTTKVDRWFGPVAHGLVGGSALSLMVYMGGQVDGGALPWWPYAAFALLVAALFTAYGVLVRERG